MSIVAMEPTKAATYQVVAKRNDSLSRRGQRIFFVSIVVVSVGIATGWAVRGAWYVLPFTLLEMGVLFVALRLLATHASDFESLSIDGDRVLLVRRSRGSESRHEFNRQWAHLIVRRIGPGQRYGLAMRSHGKEVSFGDLLTDEQRLQVAGELRKRLKTYY